MENQRVVKQETHQEPQSLILSSPAPLAEIFSDSGGVTSTGKRPKTWNLVPTHDENSNKRSKLEGTFCRNADHNDGDDDDGVRQSTINQCRDIVLPERFLDPLTPLERERLTSTWSSKSLVVARSCRQFWKAGDYEPDITNHHDSSYSAGMAHVRVHPRFLHSNATSHKWALGAFAELMDNALDEVCNGATCVNVDMLVNMKDGSKMLLFQDDGGGMNQDKMRQCMSLGYSVKSKLAHTIGQYGNGFKTSTMRLGADVIVFSCCQGKDGRSPTKSIGMLSYTFLQSTGKEDIVVPMIDYKQDGQVWTKMLPSSSDDWYRNLDTIIQWSPYSGEHELLEQFDCIENQGTRIIIYNLWEDDMGQLELDFDTDPEDIQIRGVNRDEKKIAMARKYPNSKHFLTYQHSLKSYTSILYLRLPPGFRIILRGKDVEHHNLVDDIMHKKETLYKPKLLNEGIKDPDVSPATIQALVTLGFAKDAQDHIDIQGYNVYHKNRLIKPFWRVWNAAGSDGRGVIGVLEANFVEPAHDKQGFEKTTTLSRLEARLVQIQKDYWRDHCHEVGYAPRRPVNRAAASPKVSPLPSKSRTVKGTAFDKLDESFREMPIKKATKQFDQASPHTDCSSEDEVTTSNNFESSVPGNQIHRHYSIKTDKIGGNLRTEINADMVVELRKENLELKKSLHDATGSMKRDLQFERDRCKSLEARLAEANKKIAGMDDEQEALIQIFSEERERRETEERNLRNQLKVAKSTIHELLDKVKALEEMKLPCCKT